MAASINSSINTAAMTYRPNAYRSLQLGNLCPPVEDGRCRDDITIRDFANRLWTNREGKRQEPRNSAGLGRRIGRFPLTSPLASWVVDIISNYQPPKAVIDLVRPYSADLHELFKRERATSTGYHDLDLIELVYQITLEAGGDILLAADRSLNPADVQSEYHSSQAAQDNHFAPWGKLLTGLDCDPPIISQFPFYLMMCQSFGFEKESSRENYVYSALTGVDWAKGTNKYSNKFRDFEKRARGATVDLDGELSGRDTSFWRISLGYLGAMNKLENSRVFRTPRESHIASGLDPYLLMAVRGFDTIGSAYMCSDGAAFLDNRGMDSLIGSAVPNDVMDLHTDVLTGETRNLLRLLYPNGWPIEQSIKTMSTVLSGMLCELFRGHKRARFSNREDGRIAATSPPYSFCRARHRRIFETIETYSAKYPEFWDWTRKIYGLAKDQITEAGLNEPLIKALYRGISQVLLPESAYNHFYDEGYFAMIERNLDEAGQNEDRDQIKRALRVQNRLGELVCDIHNLWNTQLLKSDKKPGWGHEFDKKSDDLFRQVGELLSNGSCGETEGRLFEAYKFAIPYGRLSMGPPYIAYHTIAAIILTDGVVWSS